jgi:hypothetical protein
MLGFALCAGARAQAPDPESTPLPPIDVEGQRSPLDSNRPRYEKMGPCLGCDDEVAHKEGFLSRFLHFTVLPAEPPDNRDKVAASELGAPLAELDDKHTP